MRLSATAPNKPTLTPRQQLFASRFGYTGLAAPPEPVLGGTTISNDSALADARVGFHAAFMESFDASPDEIERVALEVTSKNRIEEHAWLGDPPAFVEWVTNRQLGDLEAFSMRLVNRKWQNGLRIKSDDFDDDNLGLMPAAVAGLAQKGREHRADLLVYLLLNGFDGNAFPDVGDGLAFDGAFFFDVNADTGSNKLTLPFDSAALAAAELLLGRQKRYDGSKYRARGTHIICGPKVAPAAHKVITQEYLAGGESNTNKARYQVLEHPLIDGAYEDDWFVADLSKPYKPLMLQIREGITTSALASKNQIPYFQNAEFWFGAQSRYNAGYFERRLIVGSRPA